jgi:hypothetical protein
MEKMLANGTSIGSSQVGLGKNCIRVISTKG